MIHEILNPSKGILAVPLSITYPINGAEKTLCIGVICVTSASPDTLEYTHLEDLRLFRDKFQQVFHQYIDEMIRIYGKGYLNYLPLQECYTTFNESFDIYATKVVIMPNTEHLYQREHDENDTSTQLEQVVAQAVLAVTPQELYDAFQEIEQKYTIGPDTGESRLKRIQQAFEGRENDVILIEELERFFSGTSDARKNTRDAFNWLNKKFAQNERPIEFERVTGYRVRKKAT